MRKSELRGIFVPHITPFTRDGDLDEAALRTCVQFWMNSGIAGLVPCGSNGEAPYLSREERRQVIGTVVDEVNGRVRVVAGTGSMSTRETILLTNDARDLGVDAALVVTPFYFKLSNRELLAHYRSLLAAVDLPIVLYSVPKFTGISLEPAVVAQLAAEYDNVVGVKDSGGNLGAIAEIIRMVGDKIAVLAGTADLALPTLLLGGTGAVVAVANVFPQMCSRLYEAFGRGDSDEASTLQLQISYLNEVLVKKHNQLSAIKAAMKLHGLPSGYPRMPALPLDASETTDLETMLKTMRSVS